MVLRGIAFDIYLIDPVKNRRKVAFKCVRVYNYNLIDLYRRQWPKRDQMLTAFQQIDINVK